jgi:hypothetical protein
MPITMTLTASRRANAGTTEIRTIQLSTYKPGRRPQADAQGDTMRASLDPVVDTCALPFGLAKADLLCVGCLSRWQRHSHQGAAIRLPIREKARHWSNMSRAGRKYGDSGPQFAVEPPAPLPVRRLKLETTEIRYRLMPQLSRRSDEGTNLVVSTQALRVPLCHESLR